MLPVVVGLPDRRVVHARFGSGIWLCSGPSNVARPRRVGVGVLVGVARVPLVAELGEDHEDPVGASRAQLDVLVLRRVCALRTRWLRSRRLAACRPSATLLPLMVSGVASPLSTSAHAWLRSAACFSASGLGSTWSELARLRFTAGAAVRRGCSGGGRGEGQGARSGDEGKGEPKGRGSHEVFPFREAGRRA